MESSLYEGTHQELFEEFLQLVDDSDNHIAALLDLISWGSVKSLLSVGGGQGIVEASLLLNAPNASVWYLDPSSEQCEVFRKHMDQLNLVDRVEHIAKSTFQDFNTNKKFDRIVSMFSWYFVGTDKFELSKLLDMLSPGGIACIVLPNIDSIFTLFTKIMSPDKRMTLVGDNVLTALNSLDCTATIHTYTKWLSPNDLFDGKQVSKAGLAFAAFIAMRSPITFTQKEKQKIVNMFNSKKESMGIPLKWDVIIVKADEK